MRTLQLDGSGNKNQDRSIQPSAIVGELPPRALAAPTPTPRPTPVPPGAVAPPPPGGGPTGGGPPDAEPRGPLPTAPATSIAVAQASEEGVARTWLMLIAWLAVAIGCTWLGARTIRSRGPDDPDR